jgi:Mn2+/Fe2+ NRAMP family transporter
LSLERAGVNDKDHRETRLMNQKAGSKKNKKARGDGAGRGKPRLLRILGPGLITGASDDNPSGIATYSQAGAQFGFAITWTLLFTYPLMVAIQEISARIGRTTGKGIAANLRQHYPNWILQCSELDLTMHCAAADRREYDQHWCGP